MRVDFYRLSRDPAPAAVALLARKSVEAGKKVLVVGEGEGLLPTLSKAIWEGDPPAFIANGIAGGEHDARQPVLLAEKVEPANGASLLILADGQWRDPSEKFERAMLVFDEATIQHARDTWRMLGEGEEVERHFWKQDDAGRWVEGP
ncbi:DNA polymerase III subunit chi [Alteraurantiacibacter aquimixticola]|uniref:DNA polymerase III subunit chi n=1 Tax=Alteraurantiacibacter aquimixticola TaxID=2489173 RepID=A0A4T3F2V3_9SPHN|nr:DNA polymerase III subunit chi [Alteraurantiacibacter aquimixticola]TIX51595.1 DNA polymerase III subunit chi [Alteraurantiacibacter aquimixticola]